MISFQHRLHQVTVQPDFMPGAIIRTAFVPPHPDTDGIQRQWHPRRTVWTEHAERTNRGGGGGCDDHAPSVATAVVALKPPGFKGCAMFGDGQLGPSAGNGFLSIAPRS